jgi:hypothetical protein
MDRVIERSFLCVLSAYAAALSSNRYAVAMFLIGALGWAGLAVQSWRNK